MKEVLERLNHFHIILVIGIANNGGKIQPCFFLTVKFMVLNTMLHCYLFLKADASLILNRKYILKTPALTLH